MSSILESAEGGQPKPRRTEQPAQRDRAARAPHGDTVEVSAGCASEVTADHVVMDRSAAGCIRGSLVDARISALGATRSNEIWLSHSATGAVLADRAELNGAAVLVAGNDLRIDRASAGIIAGRNVRAEHLNTLVFVGNRVTGNVRTVFSSRQALLVGMLGGLFAGLILSLTQVLFRRYHLD
jgi:hypothetical protein